MTSAYTFEGFYPFEGPAATSLELIPLTLRHKLDCAEVKLHLRQWQAFSGDERRLLLGQACTSAAGVQAYRALLLDLIQRHHAVAPTPHSAPGNEPWRDVSRWPQVVMDQCDRQQLRLPSLACWQTLEEADRHALFVLGRSQHSALEFAAAMRLFFGI